MSTSPPDLRLGEMVGYEELFGWAEPFAYTTDDTQRWLVDDAYCTKPGCTCREILLHFFRVPSTSPGTRFQLGNPFAPARLACHAKDRPQRTVSVWKRPQVQALLRQHGVRVSPAAPSIRGLTAPRLFTESR